MKPLMHFSHIDRRLTALLALALMVLVALLAYQAGALSTNAPTPTADDGKAYGVQARAKGYASQRTSPSSSSYYAQPAHRVERFAFDPNTADSTALLRLGLQPWQVRGIYRYRAKGGVFHHADDFSRVYGLTVRQYRELKPYIRIAPDYQLAAEVYGRGRTYGPSAARGGALPGGHEGPAAAASGTYGAARDTVKYPVKLRPGQRIALNGADTSALKKVPGVGSYYARRVADYGRRLGGYHHVEQLREIEGFPESALPYFKVDTHGVKKLNVNTMTLAQLRQHPYISYYQARDIIDYRRLRGPIANIEQLAMLKDFTAADIERLRPYVDF